MLVGSHEERGPATFTPYILTQFMHGVVEPHSRHQISPVTLYTPHNNIIPLLNNNRIIIYYDYVNLE